MDRRTTIKWIIAASASVPALREFARGDGKDSSLVTAYVPTPNGYGSDPDMLRVYKSGELWPLTLTEAQRKTATLLSDLIIPADASSPSASQVGVVDFLDEWISAPYDQQRQDKKMVLEGFAWLDRESTRRFSTSFAALDQARQSAICDDICWLPKAKPRFVAAAKFFALYRDLTAGGFYTTPEGRRDLQYVGNIPLPRFEGPSLEVLKKVGLA